VKNEMHPLQIRCDRDGVLWLSGEFDMTEMERFVRTATAQVDGRREVVLDLSELTFPGLFRDRSHRAIRQAGVRKGSFPSRC
jgi:hypothetical protein